MKNQTVTDIAIILLAVLVIIMCSYKKTEYIPNQDIITLKFKSECNYCKIRYYDGENVKEIYNITDFENEFIYTNKKIYIEAVKNKINIYKNGVYYGGYWESNCENTNMFLSLYLNNNPIKLISGLDSLKIEL